MPATLLQVQGISKAFGEEEILCDVAFMVREGERFGLIGPNGAGKTTLFHIITGLEHPDGVGDAIVPRGVRVGLLAQEEAMEGAGTVFEEMLASRGDIVQIAARMHELEHAMAVPGAHENVPAFDRLLQEHAHLADDYHRLGGDMLENDARRILRGLGLGEELDSRPARVLSGGQKRRLALGKLLFSSPDLLLLDEPTNHLDLAALAWLEDYLRTYRGGVLIVSHDRYLLDRVCEHIAEIEDTRLRQFDGNYTAYFQKKEAENFALAKRADTILKERARLQESIQRLFSFRQFTRMRSLQKQLYKLEQVQLPGENEVTRMAFKPARQSGREVLAVEDLRKRFGPEPLLEDIRFTLRRGDRVALFGPNGSGKTTLLRMLVGEQQPDAGLIRLGNQVEWYYYDQEGGNLDPRLTVLQEVMKLNPHLSQTDIRRTLARFLIFEEDVERPVGTLSGGERSRVSLAKMLLSGANFLLLDEPTNHLDIEGKESLEGALADYQGTVLMVSHDRYFIDKVATRILELRDGRIYEYLGNYTEYLEKKEEGKRQKEEAEKQGGRRSVGAGSQKPAVREGVGGKKRARQEQARIIAELEGRIAGLEARKCALETEIADPSTYAHGTRGLEAAREYEQVLRELDATSRDWETESEALAGMR